MIKRGSASLTRPLATRIVTSLLLARTAHRREPIDRAARKQSRIANTTIMVIEFH